MERSPEVVCAGTPPVAADRRPGRRAAADLADPDVADTLDPSEWSAHRLIGIANIRRYHELFEAAAKAGWIADEVENMAALAVSPEAQQKLREHGINRPIHRGSHPDCTRKLEEQLLKIIEKLTVEDLDPQNGQYQADARALFDDLQRELRQDMVERDRIGFLQNPAGARNA